MGSLLSYMTSSSISAYIYFYSYVDDPHARRPKDTSQNRQYVKWRLSHAKSPVRPPKTRIACVSRTYVNGSMGKQCCNFATNLEGLAAHKRAVPGWRPFSGQRGENCSPARLLRRNSLLVLTKKFCYLAILSRGFRVLGINACQNVILLGQ